MNTLVHLVALAVKNDHKAQSNIFNSFYAPMLGLCLRMTGDRYVAEDIVQEGFVKAFLKIKRLKEPHKFEGWLKRIMVNECIDYIRRMKTLEPLNGEIENVEDDSDDRWYKDISFETISKQIDDLPQGCRQVFTLYLIEEYKHKEIAQMLNVSISTVKSQYRYAITLLKTKLKADIK